MSAPQHVEIYPTEMERIKPVFERLNRAWQNKPVSDPYQAALEFNEMASNMMSEIGFEIEVEWFQAGSEPEAESPLALPPSNAPVMYVPRVIITGRIRPEEETDHDRMQHEVVTGKADGQAGYIREDGTRREDPIKKVII